MQLGKALVGAVIGSAIGVALLVAAYFLFRTEHTAFAILVAVCVGLGVRAMAATKGHASYVRGALTALVAIGAFMGGNLLIVELATRQVAASAVQPARASDAAAEVSAKDASGPASDAPAAEMSGRDDRPRLGGGAIGNVRVRKEFSAWEFILLSVAALVAYELGRGTGTATATASETAPTTVPPPA